MRLIDGDVLLKDIRELLFTEEEPSMLLTEAGEAIHNSAIELALFEVEEAERIDAVPVVRCKDCMYSLGFPFVPEGHVMCGVFDIVQPHDAFCDCGATKEEAEEE